MRQLYLSSEAERFCKRTDYDLQWYLWLRTALFNTNRCHIYCRTRHELRIRTWLHRLYLWRHQAYLEEAQLIFHQQCLPHFQVVSIFSVLVLKIIILILMLYLDIHDAFFSEILFSGDFQLNTASDLQTLAGFSSPGVLSGQWPNQLTAAAAQAALQQQYVSYFCLK